MHDSISAKGSYPKPKLANLQNKHDCMCDMISCCPFIILISVNIVQFYIPLSKLCSIISARRVPIFTGY